MLVFNVSHVYRFREIAIPRSELLSLPDDKDLIYAIKIRKQLLQR